MNAADVTRCIGIPHLTLDNFELAEPDSRYILTSPRSLEACERCDIRPIELLRTPVEEFYNEYKDRDYLTRSDILDEFHLQEKVRLAKLTQAREERQRIIYLEAESEASKIPEYLDDKDYSSPKRSKSPTRRSKSPKKTDAKRVAWDKSTKGAQLPLRSSLDNMTDTVSPTPVKTEKSWAESLRSTGSRPTSSTPIKQTVSNEDISVIGRRSSMKNRNKPGVRSSSVPRNRREINTDNYALASQSEVRLSRRSSSDLRTSYDRLQEAHQELTANVSQLEQELKALKIQQHREEVLQKKKANIESLKLQKQTRNATTKARNSRNKLAHMKGVEEGASVSALRRLHNMESHSRQHLLRETQSHINELKAEIKQYKAQRSAKLIQEDRKNWEEVTTVRRSRALERADIKARRFIRDKSAKARRMRMARERQHTMNMRNIIAREEMNLLKNLDTIISKEKKADYLINEKQRMIRKSRDSSRRSATARGTGLRTAKSFDKMSLEAEMMAHLEAKGTASRWHL